MITLKQLQEEMNEEFNKWFEQEIILDQEVRTVLKGIKSFLHQQTTLAYNAGKAEMLDTVLKEIDKKLNSIGRPVEGISQELYNNDTWVNIGILEALDTLKNKLLDNK